MQEDYKNTTSSDALTQEDKSVNQKSLDNNCRLDKNRSGRISLRNSLDNVLEEYGELDEIAKKSFRAAKVKRLFKECMIDVYGNNAIVVLDKVNDVYILREKDKGLRCEALPDDKDINRMVIYVCDSMVHADLDSRQEFIKFWFNKHNEQIDKYDILTSKMGMRRRFPYKEDVKLLRGQMLGDGRSNNSPKKEKTNLSWRQKRQLKKELDAISNPKVKESLTNLIGMD